MDPKQFAPSAYTGRYGWVRVRLAGVGSDMARQLVTNTWKRTAPRRLVPDYELRGKPYKALRRFQPPPPPNRRTTTSRRAAPLNAIDICLINRCAATPTLSCRT